MNYTILGKKRTGRLGRIDDFSIGISGISLNKKYRGNEWITLAINDEGFLCMSFEKKEDSYHISDTGNGLYVRVHNGIREMFKFGSYSFTDKDGEWNISNCKANDKGDF